MRVKSLPQLRLAGRTIPPSIFSIMRVKLVLGRQRIYWAFVLRTSQKDDACKLWATRARGLFGSFLSIPAISLACCAAALNPYCAFWGLELSSNLLVQDSRKCRLEGRRQVANFIPSHVVVALLSSSSKVARMVSSKCLSLNGLLRNATAPACIAC